MYFDTVACETVRPSFNSSPWILGAPQSGFSSANSRRVRTADRNVRRRFPNHLTMTGQ